MAAVNPGDMDEFLERVEEVNRKIKGIMSGEIDVEELEKKEMEEERLKKFQQEEKIRKEEERLQKGKSGKGHKEDYKRFCKHCFTEYQIDIEKCNHCKHETITKEFQERMQELRHKLEEYKGKQRLKIERKSKWENWIKTQAMFYKKTATNYNKWDFFDPSSDEDKKDEEPIVPSDDPSFKAMEKDMLERRKKRQADYKEATILKDKGNEYLKKGLNKLALKTYTDAINIKKDYKQLYTNRALVYIKLRDYENAMTDCTRMLEYCELFEDGFETSKDLCYKALLRRAEALRGLSRFSDAKNDLETALRLYPAEKDGVHLLEMVKEQIGMEEEMKKIISKKEDMKETEFIDAVLARVKSSGYLFDEEIDRILDIIENEEYRLYFAGHGGLTTLKNTIKHNPSCLKLIKLVLEDMKMVHRFIDMDGFTPLLEAAAKFAEIEDTQNLHIMLEIIETNSLDETLRKNLCAKKDKIKAMSIMTINTVALNRENIKIFTLLVSLLSNLCYEGDRIRDMVNEESSSLLKFISLALDLAHVGSDTETLVFKQTCVGFIGNLCVNASFRELYSSEANISQIVGFLRKEKEEKKAGWVQCTEKLLAILINCSLIEIAGRVMVEQGVVGVLARLMEVSEGLVRERCFGLLAKISGKYTNVPALIGQEKAIITMMFSVLLMKAEDKLDNCIR